jgi:hypothetical protein
VDYSFIGNYLPEDIQDSRKKRKVGKMDLYDLEVSVHVHLPESIHIGAPMLN